LMVVPEEEWGCSCVYIADRQLPFRLHKHRPTFLSQLIRLFSHLHPCYNATRPQPLRWYITIAFVCPSYPTNSLIPLDVNFSFIQNADIVCHRKHSNANTVTYYFPCSLTIEKLRKMDPPRVSSDVNYTGFCYSTLQPISRDIRFGWVVIKCEYVRQTSGVPFTVSLLPLRVSVGCVMHIRISCPSRLLWKPSGWGFI
jgi:hypothetical protein